MVQNQHYIKLSSVIYGLRKFSANGIQTWKLKPYKEQGSGPS
jgi:hypothetical protein